MCKRAFADLSVIVEKLAHLKKMGVITDKGSTNPVPERNHRNAPCANIKWKYQQSPPSTVFFLFFLVFV